MLFLKKITYWVIAILFFIIVIIISLFIRRVRLGILDSSRIGHILDETINYLNFKKKKTYDIWISSGPICNNFLYKKIKKKLFVTSNDLGNIFLRVYNLILKFNLTKNIIFKYNARAYLIWRKIYQKNLLKFDKQEITEIENELVKKKIFLNTKIVCINIRNKNYLKKIIPSKNHSYHNYRNSNLENYLVTIKYLLKKEYQVFLMGKYHDKLKIRHKNFINISKINFKNDMIDFYLVSKSNFIICNNTGWETIGAYYNKDIIMADGIGMGITHFGYPYYIIFKHLINTKNNRKINLNNIIENNFHFKTNVDEYKKDSLCVQDNSSAEILNLIKEYLNGKFSLQNKKYKKIQDQIKIKIINSFKNAPENYKKNLYINNRKIFWNFGINFLKKNTN
jgi:putative glycosyltransferase (TIGR04372 family)